MCYHFLQKYHRFISWRPKGTQFSLCCYVYLLLLLLLLLLLWQSIKPWLLHRRKRSEIVLEYLDIHPTAIHVLYELNWDFLSHVRADDDSTCDACLLGSDLEFSFCLLLVGNRFWWSVNYSKPFKGGTIHWHFSLEWCWEWFFTPLHVFHNFLWFHSFLSAFSPSDSRSTALPWSKHIFYFKSHLEREKKC